jgi:parallel beta-helix repeat protein
MYGLIIRNNTFINSGISLTDYYHNTRYWNSHTIENNTVNGKPIYYYKNAEDVVVPLDAGQVICANCSSILLHDLSLTNASGVQLGFCSNVTVSDCVIAGNRNYFGGLYLKNSAQIVINHNLIKNNTQQGICLRESSGNTITNNRISGCSGGQIEINLGCGIDLWYMNTNNVIRENIIMDNGKGVFLGYSSSNNLYHNKFANKGWNAYEMDSGNSWDKGYPTGGNYWDDYTGSDPDNDGIGNSPYAIPGEDDYDYYPLMNPFVLGDMNVDQQVDFGDINPFVLALSNPVLYQNTYHLLPVLHGDCNQNGVFGFDDINPFVAILSGG